MNVAADKLATYDLQEYGSMKPIVPFDPMSGIQLSISGQTVTRRIHAAIHQQQHFVPLQQYSRSWFQWNQDTFHDIDWANFAIVYWRFPQQRTFFSKLGWKKLPVAARLHKRTPCYDHRGPTCNEDNKDDDHIYQCEHISRSSWRTSFFKAIDEKFHVTLDPDLLAIIRLGLWAYFTNCSPDFSERFPNGYLTSPYKVLITQQNKIGWDHFVRGKFTKEWRLVQYQFAKRYGLVKQSEGWTVDLVKMMANSSFQLWELRNTCRHGYDDASKQQSIYEKTHRKVRCLYLLQPMVLQQDRVLFRDTVEEHLLSAVPQLRSWIVHNRRLIQHSVKVAKAQSQLQIHHIQQFFPRRGTTQSRTAPPIQRPAPRRHRITRISNFFPAVVRPRSTIRILPAIDETTAITLNGLQRRIIRRRQLNLPDLFPDHPG
jgi:hypothetical protein